MTSAVIYEDMEAETVAGLLSVKERRLRDYVQMGMPSKQVGRVRTFNWPDVLAWYVEYKAAALESPAPSNPDSEDDATDDKKEDIRQANLRKTRAEADLKQLALMRQRGQVIVISDAKVRLERMLGNLRAKLLGMAPKLANRLEGERERTAREAAIKDEMESLCREISTGGVLNVSDTAEDGETIDVEAAAEDRFSNLDIAAQILATLDAYDHLQP